MEMNPTGIGKFNTLSVGTPPGCSWWKRKTPLCIISTVIFLAIDPTGKNDNCVCLLLTIRGNPSIHLSPPSHEPWPTTLQCAPSLHDIQVVYDIDNARCFGSATFFFFCIFLLYFHAAKRAVVFCDGHQLVMTRWNDRPVLFPPPRSCVMCPIHLLDRIGVLRWVYDSTLKFLNLSIQLAIIYKIN